VVFFFLVWEEWSVRFLTLWKVWYVFHGYGSADYALPVAPSASRDSSKLNRRAVGKTRVWLRRLRPTRGTRHWLETRATAPLPYGRDSLGFRRLRFRLSGKRSTSCRGLLHRLKTCATAPTHRGGEACTTPYKKPHLPPLTHRDTIGDWKKWKKGTNTDYGFKGNPQRMLVRIVHVDCRRSKR